MPGPPFAVNPARETFELLLAKFLVGGLRVLPESWALGLGRGLGSLACRLDQRHRDIALENLSASLPNLDESGRFRVVEGVYRGFGLTLSEWAQAQGWGREELLARVDWEGLEHMEEALSRGRGAVALVGHLGNWELTGAVCAARYPGRVMVAAQEQNNRRFDRYINDLRRSRGMEVVLSKRGASDGLLKGLRENKILGILADQHAGEGGEVLPFFGRSCSVLRSPVILARRGRSSLLPAVLRRLGGGRFLFRFLPAVDLSGTVREGTARWLKVFEDLVRERPEDWFWVHRRWKIRP